MPTTDFLKLEEMHLMYTICHIVCKDGLLVDQDKIIATLDMVSPTSVQEMTSTLGHTGYY
jgi:hypothetical protein